MTKVSQVHKGRNISERSKIRCQGENSYGRGLFEQYNKIHYISETRTPEIARRRGSFVAQYISLGFSSKPPGYGKWAGKYHTFCKSFKSDNWLDVPSNPEKVRDLRAIQQCRHAIDDNCAPLLMGGVLKSNLYLLA